MPMARALVPSFRNCSETVPERFPAVAAAAQRSTTSGMSFNVFMALSWSADEDEFADLRPQLGFDGEDVDAAGKRSVTFAQDVPAQLADVRFGRQPGVRIGQLRREI